MVKTCTPSAFHATNLIITHYTVRYSLARWSVGSDSFLTRTEPLQSSFSIEPRPPNLDDHFGEDLSVIAMFTFAQTNRAKGGNVPGSEIRVNKHP